jgi:methyltransferase
MTPSFAAILILGYVSLQRLGELLLARANTRRLVADGAVEVAPRHYGLIVAVHVAWLATLWLAVGHRPLHLLPLVLFAVVQLLRFWVLLTLGRRWTTRIIVRPGERLVAAGPYRWLAHPKYTVVMLEIALLPLVFGFWQVALVFSLLNAAVLSIRIPAEARALREMTHGRWPQ